MLLRRLSRVSDARGDGEGRSDGVARFGDERGLDEELCAHTIYKNEVIMREQSSDVAEVNARQNRESIRYLLISRNWL